MKKAHKSREKGKNEMIRTGKDFAFLSLPLRSGHHDLSLTTDGEKNM